MPSESSADLEHLAERVAEQLAHVVDVLGHPREQVALGRALVVGEAEPLQVVVDGHAQLVGDLLAAALQPQVGEVLRARTRRRRWPGSARRSPRGRSTSTSNGAWRSPMMWSTISAIGHGLASSASASTPVPAARADERAPLAQHVGLEDLDAGAHSSSVVRAAPSRSSRAGSGVKSSRAGSAWSATLTMPRCSQPPRASRLLVLAVDGVGDDERGDAGADEIQGRVVAALADAAGGLAELGGEVRDAAQQLDVVGPELLQLRVVVVGHQRAGDRAHRAAVGGEHGLLEQRRGRRARRPRRRRCARRGGGR